MSNNNGVLALLEYYEKDKNICRSDMIEIIIAAIKNAAAKRYAGQELKVEINPKTGAVKAWQVFTITDSVADPTTEMHIDKARLYTDNPQIGQQLLKDVDLDVILGRIDVKNVQQILMQKIRNNEKDRIYEDFKDQVGDIVTGIVRRREKGNIIVDLGKAEALLLKRECIPGEDYSAGDQIRCLLLEIENSMRGNEIILSRASYKFVRRLFELEASEIADGSVTIEAIAREPGYRTKIAVSSIDPKIDPVGACVGAGGSRVKSIVRELNGEKIDVIKYSDDPKTLLEECVKPAQVKNIKIFEDQKRIYFEVAEADYSLVIGKRGSNAKLTSRLLGWKLDIQKESQQDTTLEDKVQRAAGSLAQILPNLSEHQATLLANSGINSADAFEGVEEADLVEMGFSPAEAAELLIQVNRHLGK
ncbi:MAG: transcription termination factor NusA [Opitutales bacterium]|nr:transcription termination factor NusA [Opitutales bacterium]